MWVINTLVNVVTQCFVQILHGLIRIIDSLYAFASKYVTSLCVFASRYVTSRSMWIITFQ